MNIKTMAGAHEVQKVLKLGLSSIQDDLAIVSDPLMQTGRAVPNVAIDGTCGRQGREHEAPST